MTDWRTMPHEFFERLRNLDIELPENRIEDRV